MGYKVKRSTGAEEIVQKKPNYRVDWEWSEPDRVGFTHSVLIDYVNATNAERAINKVRKMIEDEYEISRRDMRIIQVTMIG